MADDDPLSRQLVRRALADDGHVVVDAVDGPSALDGAGASDLLILDIRMPPPNGWEVLQAVRTRHPRLPVIMMSGFGSPDAKVRGLDAGADEFLGKPIDVRVLQARVRRLLALTTPELPGVRHLRLLPYEQAVVVAGRRVLLTPHEFRMLEALARVPGRVWSREDLMREAWRRPRSAGSRAVDAMMRTLRKKLGDDALKPTFIRTVHGSGYALLLNVLVSEGSEADR